jgi:acetyltransferase EpsM
MNSLLLWGAGGHGKVVLDVALAQGRFASIAFIDDDAPNMAAELCGKPVVGVSSDLELLARNGYGHFVIAIGDNRVRASCYQRALNSPLLPATLIHPSAIVSPGASVGAGTVVMPGVVINSGAIVGADCIVNTGAVVEHDCLIGDHVHLGPGVLLGGNVKVGHLAQLGIGAIALPGADIGESALVGAGAVVLRSVPPNVTAIGVPARVLGRLP